MLSNFIIFKIHFYFSGEKNNSTQNIHIFPVNKAFSYLNHFYYCLLFCKCKYISTYIIQKIYDPTKLDLLYTLIRGFEDVPLQAQLTMRL